ncbi:unnamed protein product [Brachionus calyciflorus]|uniref:EGF-like domain-containing protein n=1 Tax=Brachionus calyciflorus TaxID=104777 RepID=A0A813X9L2_9BILA|nr:unnamed protein product [Brachionus calyciflorus]
MRNYFYLALITLVLASSVNCFFDEDVNNYSKREYCIEASSCVRNHEYHICDCPDADINHYDDYHIDINLKLFCEEIPCKNCKEIMRSLNYAFECQCNNTKQYFYCKIQTWMDPIEDNLTNNSLFANNDRETNIESTTTISQFPINETIVLRNSTKLAFIFLYFIASSVKCIDEDIKYLTGAYCIDTDSCDRNGDSRVCECPDADRDHFEDYDNLKLFCSETTCKNCKDIDYSFIYGSAVECDCKNGKRKYYCKRSKIAPWMNPNTNSSIFFYGLVNNDHEKKIENITTFSKLLTNKTILIQNSTKNKEEYIWHENSYGQIIIENKNNRDVKVEKTCVLNGNVNLCDCQTNFRNLLKNCDNSYLFCDRESSCRDCEENFYPEHGFGYKCKCNGIKKDFICKDQAELIEALVLIIQAIFIFIFWSLIVCCCACCIGYFTIKGCKNTITKFFKSDSRVINLYQMVPNDQSRTVYSNRNKLELNEV